MTKIEDILQEKAFLEKILKCKTQGEIKTAFKEKGYDISDGEMEYLKEFFTRAYREVQQISPEELEQISGGLSDESIIDLFFTGLGALTGLAVGAKAGYVLAQSAEAQGKNIGKWGYIWRTALAAIASSGAVSGTIYLLEKLDK